MRDADFDKISSGLKFNQAVSGADPWWLASPEKFRQLTETLKSSGLQPINSPRIQTFNGMLAEIYVGNGTNGIDFTCTPFVVGGQVDLTIHGNVVGTNARGAVTNRFSAGTSVENRGGVVFRTANMDGNRESNLMVIAGVELVTNLVAAGNPPAHSMAQHSRAKTFKLDHPLRQDELKEQLLAAGVEIPTTAYFYLDSGILLVRGSDEQLARVYRLVLKLNGFSAKTIAEAAASFVKDLSAAPATDENSANLFSRTFKVSAYVFNHALQDVPGLQTNNVSMTAYSLFSKLGVDLKPPESVFYNDQLGLLFVRASLPDLDTIENVLSALNVSAPQIHIKARFIEVAGSVAANLYLGSFNAASLHTAADDPDQPSRDTLNRPKFMFTATGSTSFTGIMSKSQLQTAFRTLESTPGVEELAEPEVTTSNGRQTEMRATEIVSIITNFVFAENSGTQSNSITPQVAKVETGPVLDTVATVLPDDYMIDLDAKASLTEFLGYDQPTNTIAVFNAAGKKINLPGILPQLRVRQAGAHVNLYDGQTLLLGKFKTEAVGADNVPKPDTRELLVFVTVNLVDAAGNRIHSDGDKPFAKNRIPQPERMR